MPNEPQIIKTGSKTWENRHITFNQQIDDLYDMWNAGSGDPLADYNAMTLAIQKEIGLAISDQKSIRALGGGWSWTRIATTTGRMLNTKGLNTVFTISQASVSPDYSGNPNDLFFAQCGNSIQELNTFLKKKFRSLKTCGASNGQTIVGAMSTGTHGSAFDFGAIPDFIVGLHVVVGPARHVWLERKSYPVASALLIDKLHTELIQDDDLFNAALVSFGSFGFIHGVMVETENIYLLECHRQRIPINASLDELMETLDFSHASLPHGNERPFHFQALINPYNLSDGAYVNTMYKRAYHTNYQPPVNDSGGLSAGDDAPAFIGLLAQVLPDTTGFLVNKLVGASYKLYANQPGTLGEIFTNTTTRGKVLSAAIGIPLHQVTPVKDLLLELNDIHRFAGVFAFRYVKATKATLGFTSFSPVTCVVELDGVASSNTDSFFKEVWQTLEQEQIPFTFHWGKICDLNPSRLKTMYGLRLTSWITARHKLLDPDSLPVFTNPQMEEWGLTEPLDPPSPIV